MTLKEVEQRLAEKAAVDIIFSTCPVVLLDNERWRNTDWPEGKVVWEVKYLKMRGRLKHHPAKPHLVVITCG